MNNLKSLLYKKVNVYLYMGSPIFFAKCCVYQCSLSLWVMASKYVLVYCYQLSIVVFLA